MKNLNKIGLLLLIVSSIAIGGTVAVGSQFSYQGQLKDNGAPANGLYDMRFRIYSGFTGGVEQGTMDIDDVEVTNGLFSVALDFGDALFDGKELYLEILVTVANFPGYFSLTPRQRINAVPYAIQAEFVKNGSSPWEDFAGGIRYSDDVTIGTLTSTSPSKVTIAAGSGEEPLRLRVGGATRFLVSGDGGATTIGTPSVTAPPQGLYVEGDANQALSSHGFVKAGTFIQCGSGISGGSQRFFNNHNSSDFSVSNPAGATGNCIIDTPFDISNAFYVVSAVNIGGLASGSLIPNCGIASSTQLSCHIYNSFGSLQNGELQIIFY